MKNTKSKKYYLLLLSVVFLAVFFTGCNRAEKKGTVLASIGDFKISLSEFNERISNMPERFQLLIKKRKPEFLQEMINDTLLYQEAVRMGLLKDKEIQKVFEQAKQKILIARLLKDEIDDTIVITDEDVMSHYNEHIDNYMSPEIMRVSHILTLSKDTAKEIQEELKAGVPFESLARAKSVDPTAQRGGDIGYFPKGQLMPEFEEACSNLEIGQVSGIVKTSLGYHLIKLTDRRQPEPRNYTKVREAIRKKLRDEKRRNLFNDLLARIRGETDIVINDHVFQEEKTQTEDLGVNNNSNSKTTESEKG